MDELKEQKYVRIIAPGPTGKGTRVYNRDGTEIKGVGRVEILPFRVEDFVVARIDLLCELDATVAVQGLDGEPTVIQKGIIDG